MLSHHSPLGLTDGQQVWAATLGSAKWAVEQLQMEQLWGGPLTKPEQDLAGS